MANKPLIRPYFLGGVQSPPKRIGHLGSMKPFSEGEPESLGQVILLKRQSGDPDRVLNFGGPTPSQWGPDFWANDFRTKPPAKSPQDTDVFFLFRNIDSK